MNPDPRRPARARRPTSRRRTAFRSWARPRSRFKSKGLGFGAYFAQPHYEHGETRFVGYDPETGDAAIRSRARNTFTSRHAPGRRGRGDAAEGRSRRRRRRRGRVHRGEVPVRARRPAPAAASPTRSRWTSTTRRWGASSACWCRSAGMWNVAGSYRFAGNLELRRGRHRLRRRADARPPRRALRADGRLGGLCRAALAGRARRRISAFRAAPSDVTADSRSEYALGYAYLDPAGGWAVRVGGALSPAPNEDSNRLTRFGVSLGLGGDGLRGSLAYSRESETRPDDRNSSRNLVLATVELGNSFPSRCPAADRGVAPPWLTGDSTSPCFPSASPSAAWIPTRLLRRGRCAVR